jgi:hypothetical protein
MRVLDLAMIATVPSSNTFQATARALAGTFTMLQEPDVARRRRQGKHKQEHSVTIKGVAGTTITKAIKLCVCHLRYCYMVIIASKFKIVQAALM